MECFSVNEFIFPAPQSVEWEIGNVLSEIQRTRGNLLKSTETKQVFIETHTNALALTYMHTCMHACMVRSNYTQSTAYFKLEC